MQWINDHLGFVHYMSSLVKALLNILLVYSV